MITMELNRIQALGPCEDARAAARDVWDAAEDARAAARDAAGYAAQRTEFLRSVTETEAP